MKKLTKRLLSTILTTTLAIPTLTFSQTSPQPVNLTPETAVTTVLEKSIFIQQAKERLTIAQAERDIFYGRYSPQVGVVVRTGYEHDGTVNTTEGETAQVESSIDFYLRNRFRNAIQFEWILRGSRTDMLIPVTPPDPQDPSLALTPYMIMRMSFPIPYLSTVPYDEKAAQARADALFMIAQLAYSAVIRDAKLFIMQNYNDAIKIRSKLENQEAYITNINSSIEMIKTNNKPEVDALRASTELSSARDTASERRNAYSIQINALKSLLGLPLDTPLTISGELQYQPFDKSLDYCLTSALTTSLELRVWQTLRGAALEEVNAASRGPTRDARLSLEGSINAATNEYAVRVGIEVPLPFGDDTSRGRIVKAHSNLRLIDLEIQREQEAVKLVVTNVYNGLKEDEKRIKTLDQTIMELENARTKAMTAYLNGKIEFSAILDLERELLKNKDKKIDALRDYNIRRMELRSRIDPEHFL